MNLAVDVLHNVSDDTFFRYDPETSALHHAHTFQVLADNVQQAADLVWTLTNVDGPGALPAQLSIYRNQVAHYRARMNRSLSVSDVLVFHELGDVERLAGVLVVDSVGFRALDETPPHTRGSGNASSLSSSYYAHQDRYRIGRSS